MDIKEINEQLKKALNEDADSILSVFSDYELLNSEGDFENYLVNVQNKSFSVISLTYEYGDAEINYQTGWFDTKEEAIQQYKNDLD